MSDAQQPCALSGGAMGLCALALLRQFLQWEADHNPVIAPITDQDWKARDDLRDIAMQARVLLRQFELSATAIPSGSEISPKATEAGEVELALPGGGHSHG